MIIKKIEDNEFDKIFKIMATERKKILRDIDDPQILKTTEMSLLQIALKNGTTVECVIDDIKNTMSKFFKSSPHFKKKYIEFGFRESVSDFIYATKIIVMKLVENQ